MYVDINKPTLFLFTDASVDPHTKVGYGAYLLLGEFELEAPLEKLKVKVKRFEATNSSKLELETF
ncbi:MAG TPA: ribonuclease H, partial [Sulfurimonas sp.]